MTLEIEIVSENRDLVGDDAIREFREDGGTIGRSLQNDWILPDPDRYISGRHATIDHKGGIYYLLDTSSNGVYINDEVEPIGKGNPRRLFDGDRMRMGDFEFTVSLDSGESLAMPLEPEPTVVPDNIEQLVDEVTPQTGVKLLDEEALTGDDEFQAVLFGKPTIQKAQPKQPEPSPAVEETKPAQQKETPKKSVSVSAEDLFDSFMDGLGVSRAELHPSVNRPELMLTAGHVLREFVEGVINLLAGRANLKNTFRLDQTTVLPRHNNPLKFSESPNDLIKQLLVGDEGDYLGARDAVREACNDLMNHQNAFLDAMKSAFVEYADRFAPNELEAGFNRASPGSSLFAFRKKSKYWDLYRDLYPILTEQGGGRFPQMFGEEFVRAYERQVAEYQRHDRENQGSKNAKSTAIDPALLATQRLDTAKLDAAKRGEDKTVDTKAKSKVLDVTLETSAHDLDQSFIDELDNSIAEEVDVDPWASARFRPPH